MSLKARIAVFLIAVSLAVLVFHLIACSSSCLDLFRLNNGKHASVSVYVTSLRSDGIRFI